MARPRSASPLWSSSLDEDDDEDGGGDWGALLDASARPTTAGSLGARARTPQSGISRTNGVSRPVTPFIPVGPTPKIKVLKNRDKESMFEEIMKLSQAINDKNMVIRKQKTYASKLKLQNRRLEKTVDNLEMLGISGPRTGAPTRLRAVVQGLRLKLAKFEAVCLSQEEEIHNLQRDLRVTNSREVQVERDIFAGELGRLQQVVSNLKKSKEKLAFQNKETNYMKDKIKVLELGNERLEFSIQAIQGSVEKTNQDMESSKHAAEAALQESRQMNRLYENIMEHKNRLEKLVEIEKLKKEKVEKRMVKVSAMITKTEKQLIELVKKGVVIPGLNLRGGASEEEAEPDESASIGKVSRIYGGGLPLAAVDQGCQTSVHSSNSAGTREMKTRSPVPRLNLRKLKTPDEPDNPAVEKAIAEDIPAPEDAASKSSNKQITAPSPEVLARPPSRLAFCLEAEESCADSNLVPEAEQCQAEQSQASTATEDYGRDCYRLRGIGGKLETVSEDDQLCCDEDHKQNAAESSCDRRPCSSLGERRQQQKSCESTSSYNVSQTLVHVSAATGMQRMLEIRSQRDLECIEWLRTLEVPEAPESESENQPSSSAFARPPRIQHRPAAAAVVAYAEDTLQMTQLSRPTYELPARPGNRFARRQQPP